MSFYAFVGTTNIKFQMTNEPNKHAYLIEFQRLAFWEEHSVIHNYQTSSYFLDKFQLQSILDHFSKPSCQVCFEYS